ncbi:MAG: helix-turn-helix domain-containing protein [Oscillospiraceae bacterium]|jgi:excisionase family DNA binding protein|nr:helix-turn-helix domain-containing protein [Oscillospiraceae bacterium]
MANTDKLENWSSLKEMQAYLGVSREAILGWIYNKKMPAHKLGRLWKFKISEVDKWIRSGEGASDSESEDDN